ncbi:MAG: CPBP family intramembrane metalloprotease [Lachnospiraceae bacterium]|nr:CPBP family intramembrane metalloprotease [Lachnospiraceae bacterium]
MKYISRNLFFPQLHVDKIPSKVGGMQPPDFCIILSIKKLGKREKQMNHTLQKENLHYKPFLFIISVFVTTWGCAALMEITDYRAYRILYTVLDFLENASPLICALFLLKKYLTTDHFLRRFFLGNSCGVVRYLIVFLLFTAQFLNFYLFRLPDTSLTIQDFLSVFAGQLLLGGGLEEAGWRGYLLPCLYRRRHVLISSTAVSILWILWHLPYFFLPGTTQEGQNFISYAVIGLLTGFILTAIYLLTKSVLLCMLFHSWQNTIVMVLPADTENTGFLLTFTILGLMSALLCLFCKPQEHISD